MKNKKAEKWASTDMAPEYSVYPHYRELIVKRPSVPGDAIRYEYLPPRGYWGGLVKKGQVIRVVDLEGHQCFDTIMYDAHNLYDRISTCITQVKECKWDKWKPGDGVWSRNSHKLAFISEDTSEGHHAYAGAFCNEPYNRMCDAVPNQHSCHDNFVSAMRMAGFPDFSANDVDWGSCISVFMLIPYYEDGSVGPIIPVSNKPGDYIDFMAKRDLIVTLSNCPDELDPCNAYKPTPMYAVIFNPNKEYITKATTLEQKREAEYRKRLGISESDYNLLKTE